MMDAMWWLVMMLALLVFLLAVNASTIHEAFAAAAAASSPKEIYAEQPITHTLVYKPKKMLYIDAPVDDLKRISIYRPTIQMGRGSEGADTLSFADAYQYVHDVLPESPGAVAVSILPDASAKALLFLQRGNIQHVRNLKGKRIGVLKAIDKSIASVVLECYDVHAADVEWVTFSTPGELLGSNNNVDAMVVYAAKQEPVVKLVVSMLKQLYVVPYEDVSMTTLHIWAPFAKKGIYELHSDMKAATATAVASTATASTTTATAPETSASKGSPPPLTAVVITIDTLLYLPSDRVENPNIVDVIDYINQPSKNGFFTQYFTFHPVSIKAIRDFGRTVEGFEDRTSTANFVITTELAADHVYVADGDYYELRAAPQLRLDGLRVRVGDRVILQGQRRDSENGYYYVTRVSKEGTTLTTARILSSKDDAAMASLQEGDEVWITDKAQRGVVASGAIKVRPSSSTSPLGEPVCIEDRSLVTKEFCEAAKKTWAAPCKRDDACPYFKGAASQYRGGCDVASGMCEMPLGVKRKGFTEIESGGVPYRTGCKIEDVAKCDKGAMAWP